ncbi:hypothetical protein FZC66_18660 [Priestia megaterium]|nr:hypothetical protein FZC66_18660 [Priestia megaterium]
MNGFRKDMMPHVKDKQSQDQLRYFMEQSLWNLKKELRRTAHSKTEFEMMKISTLSLVESQEAYLNDLNLTDYFTDYKARIEALFNNHLK